LTDSAINPYSAPAAAIEALPAQPTYPARFFSWKGRIDRMRYLGYSSLALLLLIALTLTFDAFLSTSDWNSPWQETLVVCGSITGYAILPLLVHGMYARRRLHDLGQTGWLAVLACIPPINLPLSIYLTFAPGSAEPNDHGPAAKGGRLTLIWLLPISVAIPIVALLGMAIGRAAYGSYLMHRF